MVGKDGLCVCVVAVAQHMDLSILQLGHGVGQSWRGGYITS